MVALLGFLQHHQILVQHGLLREGDAVDTGQLLAGLVSSPVGTGEGEDLHGLDDLGVPQVRSAAQVRELAVGIIGDRAVFQFGDELLLVLVTLLGEVGHRIGLGDLDAAEILLLAGELQHLVLDGLEIGIRQGAAVHVHVIVETVLDGRADAELDTGEEGLEGLGHQVGRTVPEHFLGLVILPFEETDAHILRDGTEHVDGGSLGGFGFAGSLDGNGEDIGREARADGHRDVVAGHAGLVGPDTSVGEGDVDHTFQFLMSGVVLHTK